MLVLAGPGSGKTFVMIQRILNLIHEKQIRPDNILVISFSRASTLELKQRFEKQSKEKQIKKIQSEKTQTKKKQTEEKQFKEKQLENLTDTSKAQVNFATFHACFFHILKETYHYTSQDIITEKQKRDILRTILSDPAYEKKNQPHKNESRKSIEMQNQDNQNKLKNISEKTEDYLQKISCYKNKGMKELKEKENIQFQQIFHAYNNEMHHQHKLDFDDMGLLCLQLFNTKPDILEKWQEKFQYILIDEFQDINMVQFRIIQLLVKKHQNLFAVGDDDQSIYSFRGASPQIMLDFEKYYPNTEKVLLETNYRCSEKIVKESLKVIEQNKVRFQKEIRAFQNSEDEKSGIGKSGNKEGGINKRIPESKYKRGDEMVYKKQADDVIYCSFENYQKEYSYICEKIQKLVIEKNYNYSGIACIFRTNQDMTGLAESFARNKIPFVMKESCSSIFKHFIALDLIAYLQFFLKGRKRSNFLRIMNKPLRYLSRNALSSLSGETIVWKELKQYYASEKYMVSNIEQLEKNDVQIQKLDLYGVCFYIRKVIGYDSYLKEYVKEHGMNWEEAKEILYFIQESTRKMKNLEEWEDYIEQYEEALKNSSGEKEGVHIITMHACKGLEYPAVFLPDCNEGKVPHKKAASQDEIEEERRMFYVAMTRAKYHLEILYIEDKLKKHLQPSRFMSKLIPKSPPAWKQ